MKIIEPNLSPTALKIARKRYLRTDMKGHVIETPGEMFWRVAKHMAKAEVNWMSSDGRGRSLNGEAPAYWAAQFYERMVNFKFVCAGKAMFEAGNPGGTGQLSSCFVLPIEDDIHSIFKTLGDAAVVHKNNGGTGFNFSRIRPRGDKVKNVPSAASGPIDFLAAYSAALSKILQGSKRQGANIGILNADHPDIEDFIRMKDEDGTIKNFNISVGVTDEFMKAVEDHKQWPLVNPRTREVVRTVKSQDLFQLIVEHAWLTGDPGLMFLTRTNNDNPTPTVGSIEATNPCGEIPLLPYESCNLASICLQNHLKKESRVKSQESRKKQTGLWFLNSGHFVIDWADLERSVRLGVRFLDDMIEVNTYAIPEIEQMVKHGNRRIGLGVMGFSHMIVKLGISYNSIESVKLSRRLSKFIREKAEDESWKLAKVRGNFPNWDVSIYADLHPMRNCAVTMIAPTGTTSMLANTTSGIEPMFSLVTQRKTFFEGNRKNKPTEELYMIDAVFEEELQKWLKMVKAIGIVKKNDTLIIEPSNHSNNSSYVDILHHVAEYGLSSVQGLPSWFYRVFVTSHDIAPVWHVKIQAAWQQHFDNSISKTINFPHGATVEDVKEAYVKAWKLGCKGITIYRDGSKKDQVLNLAKQDSERLKGQQVDRLQTTEHVSSFQPVLLSTLQSFSLRPDSGPSDVCPECGSTAIAENGCVTCYSCGWSKCSI